MNDKDKKVNKTAAFDLAVKGYRDYEEKGDYDAAIAACNEAFCLDPDSADALSVRGLSWLAKKDYGRAMADFVRLTELEPEAAEGWNDCAGVYHERGEYSKAIECFTECITLEPKIVDYWFNRSLSYTENGDFDKALADIEQTRKLTKARGLRLTTVLQYRANVYRKMGEWDKVIRDLTLAIKSDPVNSDFFNDRGYAYRKAGELKKSRDDCNKAISLDDGQACYWYNRAMLNWKCDDLEHTLDDFSKAIDLDPSRPESWYWRGFIYHEEARQLLEIVRGYLSRKVKDDKLRVKWVRYMEAKGFDKLAVSVDEYFKDCRRDRDALDEALIHYTGVRVPQSLECAREDFTRVIALDNTHWGAYLNRGNTYKILGDRDKARSDYRHALDLAPDNREVEEALEAFEGMPTDRE